jgi:hypothetical protein
MAGKKREKVRERDVGGLKYFDRLQPLLNRLHDVGCERDRAGNRRLHLDQYCMLVLLFLFNPVVSSLRALQQASELKKVQRKLNCPRVSLGSLSESTQVFESERVAEIVEELSLDLQPVVNDPRLQDVKQTLVAVDGSLLKKLPQITQASWSNHADGWRLHTQFEVLRGIPRRNDLTNARNSGSSNEKTVLREHLQADCCYVTDRGYEQFSLFNAIVDAQSSYVCRVRNDHHFEATEMRPLSDEANAAGVIEDKIGKLGSPNSRRIEHPHHTVRLVTVRAEQHPKRGGRKRPAATQDLVLATNLLDVPPEVIGLIYRYRWTVEIFFRFFKHILGCRHLLSHDPVGIEIQTYCAIIACMLISLWTGRKPSLRTYEMICYYFTGLADEEELLAHITKLKSADQ